MDTPPTETEPLDPPAPESSGAEQTARPHVGWALIVLLGALSAFTPLSIDMYLPAMRGIEQDLAARAGSAAYTLSFFLIGLGAGQFVCGPLSDRVGRRGPVLVGCAGFAVAAGLCAVARSMEWLIAARLAMGASGAAGVVVARAVVRDRYTTREAAAVYSALAMIGGLAPIIAPLLGAALLAVADWRWIFWTLAGGGAVCWVAAVRVLPETLPAERRSREPLSAALGGAWRACRNPEFLRNALALSLAYGALFAYLGGSPQVFMGTFGLTRWQYTGLFAANSVGLYAGAQYNRRLLLKYGPSAILRVAATVAMLCGVALFVVAWTGWGGVWAVAGLTFACVAGFGLTFPNATAAAMAPVAGQAGTASAVLGLGQYAVGAIGGAVAGGLYQGTAVAMAGVMAVSLVGARVAVGWGRAGKT